MRRIHFHSITTQHVRKDHFKIILHFIFTSIKSGGYLSSVFGKPIVIINYASIRITFPAQLSILEFTVLAMISEL
jgi:hypothetical protein